MKKKTAKKAFNHSDKQHLQYRNQYNFKQFTILNEGK